MVARLNARRGPPGRLATAAGERDDVVERGLGVRGRAPFGDLERGPRDLSRPATAFARAAVVRRT